MYTFVSNSTICDPWRGKNALIFFFLPSHLAADKFWVVESLTLPVLSLQAPDQYSCVTPRQDLQLLNSHILEEAELKY